MKFAQGLLPMRSLKVVFCLAVALTAGVSASHAQGNSPGGSSGIPASGTPSETNNQAGQSGGPSGGSSGPSGGEGGPGGSSGPSGGEGGPSGSSGPSGGEGGPGGSGGEGGPGGSGGEGGPGGSGGEGGPGAGGGPGGGEGGPGAGGGPGGGEGGPGGNPGAGGGEGGPGGNPGAGGGDSPENAQGDRSVGEGETGIWLVLLVLLVTVVLAWKRVGEWGRVRLEPAVDQLQRAASRLDARSSSVRISAWSPSVGASSLEPVLGQPLVKPGQISVLVSKEDGQAEVAAVDLLKLPGSAVGLVSDQMNSTRIEASLGERVESTRGRLLFSDDPGCTGDGIGSLIGALEGVGAPVSVVMDLRGELGGVDPHGALPGLVTRLAPWCQAHDLGLLLLVPRGPSREALQELKEKHSLFAVAVSENEHVELIESTE